MKFSKRRWKKRVEYTGHDVFAVCKDLATCTEAEFLLLSSPMLPSVFSELFTRTSSAQAQATTAAALLDPAVLGESLYTFQNGTWPTRTAKRWKAIYD